MATDQNLRRPGLRERKKLRTRETIANAALQLFVERGYEQTTLDDIAEASDVSKRTIFSYFASKEDILFSDGAELLATLERTLSERPAGSSTLDALRAFVAEADFPSGASKQRQAVITADEKLLAIQRSRAAPAERIIAASLARDLNVEPDDIRAIMVAAATTAAFAAARDKLFFQPDQNADARLLDEILEFLQAGIDRIQATAKPSSSSLRSSGAGTAAA